VGAAGVELPGADAVAAEFRADGAVSDSG